MDITIEIMREDNPGRENKGWFIGDVVEVRRAHTRHRIDQRCFVPKKAYIIVTDAPPRAALRLKQRLEEPDYINEDSAERELRRKRKWRFQASDLPRVVRRALANPPYYFEATSAQFKPTVVNNRVTASDRTCDDIERNG